MAKCNIKLAYRILPVNPLDFDLLGFQFRVSFHIARALPMGCSISCAAFERFSSFVKWKLRTSVGYNSTAHYRDDYLFWWGAKHRKVQIYIRYLLGDG